MSKIGELLIKEEDKNNSIVNRKKKHTYEDYETLDRRKYNCPEDTDDYE